MKNKISFGTGGIRGIMSDEYLGTDIINSDIVKRVTQGIANYINKVSENKKVVIAYDSRNNSAMYAHLSALVLCANGIKSYLFCDVRSTPELSFAVRILKCETGIMITASHNPKEYNGYKVYWNDGGQLVEPQVSEISKYINEVDKIKEINKDIALEKGLLNLLDTRLDDLYIEALKKEIINFDIKNKEKFKIVYTPLHGTGGRPVKKILGELGFNNLYIVEEQEKPNGDFPTCSYANPEDEKVFEMSKKLADKVGANICIATDPDADRLGMVAKKNGKWKYLNGNQIGILILDYILKFKKDILKNSAVVTTVVTTPMIDILANKFNLKVFRTLTGFKYIGEKIRQFENKKYDNTFLFGMEESIGYLKGTYVRDKDGILGAMLLSEISAYYDSIGSSVLDELEKLYKKYGYYSEITYHIKKEGIAGKKEIDNIMKNLREDNSNIFLETKIIKKIDYYLENILDLPKSNVIQYILEDETYITVRPSGTEPKIKYYIYTKGKTKQEADNKLNEYLNKI